ncbi:putative lipid phosphate phosphatase 3, chloroplastic isoform X3 [Hibiscus syriacus]|uniref:putative lipid phosphate phosphatase 3, chloroplastic isoform X3 n=1 Tax=Hibiscus syriacus TaxID=106335 RepID=UPI0019224A5B|nr:putative lipid phosphate phosphatase 3, chloroplastic isoform X3 [Hibiscus syriacus]
MASWNSAFLLWFKNFRSIFQDLSSKRVENSASAGNCLSSLDLPLIEQRKEEYKMQEIHLGSHTIRSHGLAVARTHMHDWLILLLLGVIEMYAMLLPMLIFLIVYIRRRDVYDLHHAVLGLLFSVLVTAVLTDSIKNAVGRPRPDFFWRCFPDGKDAYDKWGNVICHGNKNVIKEGHKSFPSGHTSWSFAGLGFLSLYLSGKIKVFDRRGHVAKLCVVFLPLLVASLVGSLRSVLLILRSCFHSRPALFTFLRLSFVGLVVSTFCYLQFFPPPYDANGWGTYAYFRVLEESIANTTNTANAGNPHNAISGEIQIANQQEGRHDNGFMGMHLARDADSTMGDMESGKS